MARQQGVIDMNMIERVARAICAAHGYRDPYIEATWPKYELHARAAIEAMHEPTIDMLLKAEVSEAKHGPIGCVTADMAYRAMITAALEGK
jgi:hypothetical protein